MEKSLGLVKSKINLKSHFFYENKKRRVNRSKMKIL